MLPTSCISLGKSPNLSVCKVRTVIILPLKGVVIIEMTDWNIGRCWHNASCSVSAGLILSSRLSFYNNACIGHIQFLEIIFYCFNVMHLTIIVKLSLCNNN